MIKHEDERRILVDYPFPDGIKSIKLVTAKDGCLVGNHWHKEKDEYFILLKGSGVAVTNLWDSKEMVVGEIISCPRGTPHTFKLVEGSQLLGLATELFDETDEYPT